MTSKTLLSFLVFIFSQTADASIELGLGMSSSTSGRQIPALTAGVGFQDWVLSATSTGANNSYYYYSNYSAALMKTWKSGDFAWGDLESAFGLGLFYSVRSFKDEGATTSENSNDFGGGPAFRVRWNVANPVYLNMEVIWGLRNLTQHLTLNGQDLVTFAIGVAL